MRIVDSQIHIWKASTPERPWPARFEPHQPTPFGMPALLREMDAAGIDRAVLVPPSFEGDRNDYALEAATEYPDRFAVMGRIDVESDTARNSLRASFEEVGMLGFRLTLRRGLYRRLLSEGHTDWLWAAAEREGIPLMINVDFDQVPQIDSIARQHPDLKLVMDHLCLDSDKKDAAAFDGFGRMIAMSQRPNVAVKCSGLACYSTDKYPYKSLHPYVRQVYDAYGPQRMFWGSDLTRSPISYRENVTMFTEEIPWLTAEDKDWIMGKALCAWLGWK